jgi:hypothetical protein
VKIVLRDHEQMPPKEHTAVGHEQTAKILMPQQGRGLVDKPATDAPNAPGKPLHGENGLARAVFKIKRMLVEFLHQVTKAL